MSEAQPRIEIYDTTLRDGTQGEGVSFSSTDKVRIADRLDAFGVDYIEGGWPGSNPKDFAFFETIAGRRFQRARIAAFGSTGRPGVSPDQDENLRQLLRAETPVATIFGKTWLLHVHSALRVDPAENLRMIRESVRFLRDAGREVLYDAEHFFDGYADDPQYALATLRAAAEGGAALLVLCDTNGGTLPHTIEAVVASVVRSLAGPRVGIHCHDDSGVGVANSLAAVRAGALHVQGTINGYGERCGNANLCSIIPNLTLKMGYPTVPPDRLRTLYDLSQFVDELANLRHNQRAPFVGESAFAHKGGIHVSAVQRLARTYEHIDPAEVGNGRRVLISELAGRSNVLYKAHERGIDLTANVPEVREIVQRLKQLEHEGFEFEAADASFELLIKKVLHHRDPFFELDGFRVIVEKRGRTGEPISEATIRLRVGDQTEYTAAEAGGPVEALDHALRKALLRFYPEIEHVRLQDFKVRIIDARAGTAARTRVLIESSDGEGLWGTVGVSENIIEASWQALVDSVEYKLLKEEERASAAAPPPPGPPGNA